MFIISLARLNMRHSGVLNGHKTRLKTFKINISSLWLHNILAWLKTFPIFQSINRFLWISGIDLTWKENKQQININTWMFFQILFDNWIFFSLLIKQLSFIIFFPQKMHRSMTTFMNFLQMPCTIFDNFIKSMTFCWSELKVTPSFFFAFKIPDAWPQLSIIT